MNFISINYKLKGGDTLTHYVKSKSSHKILTVLDIWKWSDIKQASRFISNSNKIDSWCSYKLEEHIDLNNPFPKGKHIRNNSTGNALLRSQSTIDVSFLDDHEIDWSFFIDKEGNIIGEDKIIPIDIYINEAYYKSLYEYEKARLLTLLGIPIYQKIPFSYKKNINKDIAEFFSLNEIVGEIVVQWK